MGTGAVQRLRATARDEGARITAPRGRSVPPRTRCWSATSDGCSKPHRFMARGTGKRGRKLRVAGIRTSKERVRRFMREHDLQAPHRVGHAHGPTTTEAPDAMWGTDMTATVTIGEGSAFVFVAVDHCTTECIGLHAAKSGSRFEALEPIRQGVRERFGAIGKGVAHGRRLRHDHGSNYLADDFQQEVAFFGIESSPSFVREPEGNGVAERFIRTLKENLLWVRSFETIEELRLAVLEFKRTYKRALDAGEVRLPKPRAGATRPRRAGRGRVDANTVKPLSKNPEAVHVVLLATAYWAPSWGIHQQLDDAVVTGPFVTMRLCPKRMEQTREQLSRWWAHKKVKVARLLGSRADNKCGTSQTDSNVRQRGSKLRLLLPSALALLLTTWWTGFP